MKHIFFIGIGGKGLNGIAKICLEKGYKVSGVDTAKKKEIADLKEIGAIVFDEHKQDNISKNIDVVIYSSIINQNCPELVSANRLGVKTLKRSKFLDLLTRNDFRISVCGSHGKSTTTALIGLSLINSNIDATIFGGAYAKELQGYNHLGKSKYSIVEACEYDRSFYDLVGNISVITSIEKSHMEYYKTEERMIDSFKVFARRHDRNAVILANGDSMRIREITAGIKAEVIYFGFNKCNDYVISDVKKTQTGSVFSLRRGSKRILNSLEIKVPGTYNILNFIATTVLLDILNIPINGIFATAKTFTGVSRRFEVVQADNGPIFVDDFAHHPTQVKNLFEGIKQFFPTQKTYAIFQPRQFHLMKTFIKEYGESFRKADEVIITDILPCLGDNEEDIKSISASDLAGSIERYSQRPVKLIRSFSDIVKYLKGKYTKNSVITTIGAGDIYKVRDQFLKLST